MAVLFEDSFTEASNTPLQSHTPSPIGTAWAEAEDTSGVTDITVGQVAGAIFTSLNITPGRILYTCTPVPTSPDVDVEIKMVTEGGVGAAAPWFIGARYQDNSNYYAAVSYRAADATDKKIVKKVGGVFSLLASGDFGGVANDVFKFELRGSTLRFLKNGSEMLSTTDSSITAAGKAEVGFGATDVSTDEARSNWQLDDFKVTEVEVAEGGGSTYFSANAKAALQKGYTKAGANEPYLVLELALPSGTRRYGIKGISSDARGGIEPRIAQWGTLRRAIDPLTYALSESEVTPELDDADENPTLRRLFAREVMKYPSQLRRSAATIRLISPDWTDADSYVVFTGILDGADQVAPMRWRLRLRTDDGPLRSSAGRTGAVPKVALGSYFQSAHADVQGLFASLVYGVHDSNGAGNSGFVPVYLVNTSTFKYQCALGCIKQARGLFKPDGSLIPSSQYTFGYETVRGAVFSIIDCTSDQGESTLYADLDGYTVNADGTGALITDPGLQIKHLLTNFGYGDWRAGSAWLSDPSTIDASAFSTVGTFLTTMGHEGSFWIGGEQSNLLDVYNEWLHSHAAYSWWTNLGQLTVKVLDHRPPSSIYPSDLVIEGDADELGGFQTLFDAQAIQREVVVQYVHDAAHSAYQKTLKVADLSVTEFASASLRLPWSTRRVV